jgi:hypothetical protein
MKRTVVLPLGVILIASGSFGLGYALASRSARAATARPGLMHVFLYTPLQGSTAKDYSMFDRSTREMVGKIPGLRKVWLGKLAEPLPWEGKVRSYGVAMEFDDLAALAVYAKHPVHEEWMRVYEKVREAGTTTADIVE